MPIWSLTAERLKKLADAIARKKAEHDALQAKSEKDLWCADLDEFTVEWDAQLVQDAEIQTGIRRMGRRISKKIGAGSDVAGKKGRAKAKATAKAVPKAALKAEAKSSQKFADTFGAKAKKEPDEDAVGSSDFSDSDFAVLGRGKPPPPPPEGSKARSASQSVEPEAAGRSKRAAASKAKKLFEVTSDSDDDQLLGDIGAMVKGIGKTEGESSGRLSLYAMNRPDSSHGSGGTGGLPKLKTKSSKMAFDTDSLDDTNYEMLAKPSPHKTVAKADAVDDFLSTDDDDARAPPAAAAAAADSGLVAVKKARGQPTGANKKVPPKPKPKRAPPKPKATTLSPAAKAYAVKNGIKKRILDDSEDDMADPPSPVAKPAPRARPGRAAAARRPVVVDEDSDDSITSASFDDGGDSSDDPFDPDD